MTWLSVEIVKVNTLIDIGHFLRINLLRDMILLGIKLAIVETELE